MSSNQRLFFYRDSDRSGTTVRITENGNMETLHDFAPGSLGHWSHIIAIGDRLFFYNDSNQSGSTVRLLDNGNMETLHDFAPGSLGHFSHIV
jgi:hypothetical protein